MSLIVAAWVVLPQDSVSKVHRQLPLVFFPALSWPCRWPPSHCPNHPWNGLILGAGTFGVTQLQCHDWTSHTLLCLREARTLAGVGVGVGVGRGGEGGRLAHKKQLIRRLQMAANGN